jgi:hypothetical protein
MERVFVSLLAGGMEERAVRAARAVVDFIFYASLQSHTMKSLAALSQAFWDFHQYKDVFLQLEAQVPAHFNIPKIPASTIILEHHASHFLEPVAVFLQTHHCSITPQAFDGFDLFKWITLLLPAISEAGKQKLINVVRAIPPTPCRGHSPPSPC